MKVCIVCWPLVLLLIVFLRNLSAGLGWVHVTCKL